VSDQIQGTSVTVTVSSSDGLSAALRGAHAGDTILLAAGTYSPISLNNLHYDGVVTIQSADSAHQAVLTGLTLNGSSGLAFNSMAMTTAAGTAVTVMNSSSIAFSGLTVYGTTGVDEGVGFLVRSSSGVSVTGSDFSRIGSGIGHIEDNGLTVSGNTFHNLKTDGVYGGGSSHVVVSDNSFTDFHPAPGDHPDAIQFWGGSNGAHGSDITISDNVITRGDGDVIQGIFLESSDNITITGNALTGTMYNGIALSTSSNAVVEDNFVQGFLDMGSRIITRGGSANVTVTHNTAEQVVNYQDHGTPNPNYVESDNTIIPGTAATDLSAVNSWLTQHADSILTPLTPLTVVTPVAPTPAGGLDLSPAGIDALVQQAIANQLHSLFGHGWSVV
jgi:parallel beta-helix repeat protein